MDNIYKIKYKKYKKKYLLLKQEGGYIGLVGEGTSGCLFCPPFNPGFLNIIKYFPPAHFETYLEKGIDLNFNSCEYVGKILALKQDSKFDYYEEEIEILLKIKELDPNGNYTPKLIYANVHGKFELLQKLGIYFNDNTVRCIHNKINKEYFGYIISKHTGKSLQSKYKNIDYPELEQRLLYKTIVELKNFLTIFFNRIIILFEFIKILYNNNYLHLDIRLDNITEDTKQLYLIDFGRTKIINFYDDVYYIIKRYLNQNFYMYSFEPKIYVNLLKNFNNNSINFKYLFNNKSINFQYLIRYVDIYFNELIKPYDFTKLTQLYHILQLVFNLDFKSEKTKLNINNIIYYIYYRQKKYFIEYLIKREQDYLNLIDTEKIKITDTKSLLNYIFYPIIKKYDLYSIGIILSQVVLYHYKFRKENYYNYQNDNFEIKFRKIIKKLLFHEFETVDDIMNEINELIKILNN
jgi:hypothetical protein